MSVVRKPEQLFDVRLLERYRTKGLFSEKEFKKWLSDLPNDQENADYIPAKDVLGGTSEDRSK